MTSQILTDSLRNQAASNRSALLIRFGVALFFAWWIYLLFIHRLADRDLWNSHEARAAMNAQTMMDDQQWIVPHLYDGHPELQKPVGYYWLVAGIARWRGGQVDAWAVRLPSTLSALGCGLVLVWLGIRVERGRSGWFAAIVLSSAIHFTWLARVGRIDIPLTLCVTITLACYLRICFLVPLSLTVVEVLPAGRRRTSIGRGEPERHLLLLTQAIGYVALAMGLLLKGPIAFVLPSVVIFSHLLIEGMLPHPLHFSQWWKLIRDLGLHWGIPLTLALTVPWYWLANQQTNGEFFRQFFWLHNVQRGIGGSRLRGHPWWFYGPQFAFDFLPWSLLLIPIGWRLLRKANGKLDPLARFGLIWFLSMTLLLSCFRYKRADYLVPAYPGAALFMGAVLSRQLTMSQNRMRLTALFLSLIAVGWWVRTDHVLPRVEAQREHHTLASVIRQHSPAPQEVVFFRTESHPLAFHVGRPMRTLIKWGDLREWTWVRETGFVVISKEKARRYEAQIRECDLQRVVSNSDLVDGEHETPLILFRIYRRPRRSP